jgi:hypothetical protein
MKWLRRPFKQRERFLGMGKCKNSDPTSGDICTNCPAGGTWNHKEFKGKAVCFHRAYFLAKAGNPVICDVARRACPLNNQGQEIRK